MRRPAPEKFPCLLGISGPGKDMILYIDRPVRLGREAGNSVRLDDETVSRSHSEFYTRDQHAVVRDLGSTNGTYVNGARLRKNGERVLEHRDIVKIGNSRF